MSIEDTPESHPTENGDSQQPPTRKGSWVRTLVYLVLVCILGLFVWRIYQNQQTAKNQASSQAAALLGRPVPVQVSAAEQRPMPIFLTALGTVTPYMSVTVKARVSGELLPVKFTEGQQVKQGQTIMIIDPKPYKAALDQAKGTRRGAAQERPGGVCPLQGALRSGRHLKGNDGRRRSQPGPVPGRHPSRQGGH
jgi:multidrug efflux pump subunit AcrA (membrane-fusion protein)